MNNKILFKKYISLFNFNISLSNFNITGGGNSQNGYFYREKFNYYLKT